MNESHQRNSPRTADTVSRIAGELLPGEKINRPEELVVLCRSLERELGELKEEAVKRHEFEELSKSLQWELDQSRNRINTLELYIKRLEDNEDNLLRELFSQSENIRSIRSTRP